MKFQDDISNMNTYIHTYIHTYIRTYGQAETNMPPHFFKVGGIKTPLISTAIPRPAPGLGGPWLQMTSALLLD